jgi:hypothetical protein
MMPPRRVSNRFFEAGISPTSHCCLFVCEREDVGSCDCEDPSTVEITSVLRSTPYSKFAFCYLYPSLASTSSTSRVERSQNLSNGNNATKAPSESVALAQVIFRSLLSMS